MSLDPILLESTLPPRAERAQLPLEWKRFRDLCDLVLISLRASDWEAALGRIKHLQQHQAPPSWLEAFIAEFYRQAKRAAAPIPKERKPRTPRTPRALAVKGTPGPVPLPPLAAKDRELLEQLVHMFGSTKVAAYLEISQNSIYRVWKDPERGLRESVLVKLRALDPTTMEKPKRGPRSTLHNYGLDTPAQQHVLRETLRVQLHKVMTVREVTSVLRLLISHPKMIDVVHGLMLESGLLPPK